MAEYKIVISTTVTYKAAAIRLTEDFSSVDVFFRKTMAIALEHSTSEFHIQLLRTKLSLFNHCFILLIEFGGFQRLVVSEVHFCTILPPSRML